MRASDRGVLRRPSGAIELDVVTISGPMPPKPNLPSGLDWLLAVVRELFPTLPCRVWRRLGNAGVGPRRPAARQMTCLVFITYRQRGASRLIVRRAKSANLALRVMATGGVYLAGACRPGWWCAARR